MPYINTVDERYGGGFFSAAAGARDAPASLSTSYALAEGWINEAYGALIPSNFRADLDVYGLGVLGAGRYSFRASGWNWDFSNNIWSSGLSELLIYDAWGAVVASSYLGSINLTVNSAGTFYVGVLGSTFTSTEYTLSYRYDGPIAPTNVPPPPSQEG